MNSKVVLWLLMSWGLLLSLGSLIFSDVPDWRKPLMVLATFGLIAAIWALALRRLNRQARR